MKAPLQIAFRLGMEIERMGQRMEEKTGVSLAQWSVLIRLKDLPASTAQDLAAAVGVHPSTLTQALKRLERKKFIFIGKDPKDSRKKILSLTRDGADRLEEVRQVLQAWRDDIHPMVPTMEKLADLLQQLK
ncbi:MAG: MarR family winged helix-turn-helix transcriptional regulator [Bdellovibrionia bacterium]